MAERPVFCADEGTYVRRCDTEFEYFGGFAKSQRRKCVRSLHDAFLKTHPKAKTLEISGYSENPLGESLSAFRLRLSLTDGNRVPVECAFQAGKIFEKGGPHKDLLKVSPNIAKKDPRLTESGHVIGFEFEGREFSVRPATLFYTWLYLHALDENRELADLLVQYDSFTDIAFNPKRSINCQAYAAAMYVSLVRKDELSRALSDVDFLADVILSGTASAEPDGSGRTARNETEKTAGKTKRRR